MKRLYLIIIIIISLFVTSSLLYANKTKPSSQTVVSFSSWGSQSEIGILKEIIKEYEYKNPDIKIDFIHIPQNYFQKLHLLFASGLEPDVIFINNQNIKMYTDAGLLENLTEHFQTEAPKFFKVAYECLSDNGKLYAIPRDVSELIIYYNKDIFKKSGIKNPAPTSVKELQELCKIITSKNPGVFAINYEEEPLYWTYYIASSGGGLFDNENKTVSINSEKSLEALKLYSDFVNKYHYAPSKSQIGSMTTAQMFISGKTAMYLGGRWMVPKFRETINFDWDIFEFPASTQNKVYIDASGWAVSKNSKNKTKALDFIKYLSSEEISEKFTKSGLIIPARKDVAMGEVFRSKDQKPHNSQVFTDMISKTQPTPVNKNYGKINDIIKLRASLIFDSELPPEKAFDEETVTKLKNLL